MKGTWWVRPQHPDFEQQVEGLDRAHRFFGKWCYQHESFRASRKLLQMTKCAECQSGPTRSPLAEVIARRNGLADDWGIRALEAHHIIPVWAFALDVICTELVRNDAAPLPSRSWPEWIVTTDPNGLRYQQCNAIENLIVLCSACHLTHEKIAREEHKAKLQQKYFPHLAFAYKDANKQACLEWSQEGKNNNEPYKKTGFYTWLKQQKDRDDLIGDLAADMKQDRDFPRTYRAAQSYLRQRGACDGAMEALTMAWQEYTQKMRIREEMI